MSREHQAKPDWEAFTVKQECVTPRCTWDVQLMHINRPVSSDGEREGGDAQAQTQTRRFLSLSGKPSLRADQESPLGKV